MRFIGSDILEKSSFFVNNKVGFSCKNLDKSFQGTGLPCFNCSFFLLNKAREKIKLCRMQKKGARTIVSPIDSEL